MNHVIADLRARIAALQAMLDSLEMLRAPSGSPSIPGTQFGLQPRATGVTFDNDAFFGMTAGEAAKKYLAALKKTATINAIGEALIAGGWKTSSKNLSENLRSILSRHPNFVKINGEFGLAEWYPGRKTSKRPAAGDVILSSGAEGSFVEQQRREHTERALSALSNLGKATTEPWPPSSQ